MAHEAVDCDLKNILGTLDPTYFLNSTIFSFRVQLWDCVRKA